MYENVFCCAFGKHLLRFSKVDNISLRLIFNNLKMSTWIKKVLRTQQWKQHELTTVCDIHESLKNNLLGFILKHRAESLAESDLGRSSAGPLKRFPKCTIIFPQENYPPNNRVVPLLVAMVNLSRSEPQVCVCVFASLWAGERVIKIEQILSQNPLLMVHGCSPLPVCVCVCGTPRAAELYTSRQSAC